MSAPDISVLIVTYRSRKDIEACLRSVTAALDGLASEVVVIDNASGDGTAELAAGHPGVRVLALTENVGFGAGINRGLLATKGRYVLWVNPDGRLIGGSLRQVITWMDTHPDVGIIGGRILDPDGTLQRSARAFPSYGAALGHRYSLLTKWLPSNPWSQRYLRGEATFTDAEPVDWVSGACVLHRRAVSDALRGLDEQFFMYVEDVDFCRRAWDAGWKVYFHPGVVMEHEVGGSSRQVNRPMILARHRSMWRYYIKHFRRFWPKDVLVWCMIWGRASALWLASWRRA